MKCKASTAQSDLEQLLDDETATPKALQLSLLEDITGDFSDDQEIGSGGFAVVYKGILGDRVVAVKKLSDAFMDETKFHREIECLMRVKHKNVVRFLGYCADRQGNMERYDGKLVMADVHQRLLCFEYIPKGSLDKYILDPHREWGMCYKIIKGICEGLQSLHDNRIVHLDLKPANILLDDSMTPKITDFGLSRCFNENQSRDITKSILGTIGYLAPELRDGGVIARSADLYSLGVIIIEILTGQKGYQATEDVLESWRGRLERSQQEKLCEQIRVCYETALECRDFNPMKRPASARNIIDRLHQMESIQPTVSFAKTCASLLQSSSDEEFYEVHEAAAEALPHAAAAARSSGSLYLAHFESEIHHPRGAKSCGCYRCGKGGGFWVRGDKVTCLACGARYCTGCMFHAMGSMPEGRKCLACIGRPVAESRRSALGRGSRVLRRLLSAAEVELVMRSERECTANQLRPEDVYVNGAKLAPEELASLQGCPCPPSRLRPGFYWYDKVSGFWGKEGHKPHCIISPNLNVGGILDENASNGNTGILVNGREITKSELQILKFAGVQCGKAHFCLNADGTYQKTVKGKIWDKPIVKLLSPVLSLPTPNKAANQCGEEIVNLGNRPYYLEQRTIQKLLLVGSGSSTILKQAKFSYKSKPFSMDECEDLKLIIQSNIYRYLGILLEGRERFEEEALAGRRKIHLNDPSSSGHSESGFCDEVTEYSIVPRLKAFSDWILNVTALGNLEDFFPAASREYAPLVEELWKGPAIQATYRRRSELPFLPSAASYFLDRAVDISRTEYEICDMDILYADGITPSDGLASTDISFPQLSLDVRFVDEPDSQDTMLRYQLIRISNKGLFENSKWLQVFDDVSLIIFCVAVSDYDEYYEDVNGTIFNKMLESRQLFESLVLHPTFEQMDFLVLLTKFDLLEQKIGKSPLTACDWFSDFTTLVSRNLINGSSSRSTRSSSKNGASLAQMAAHYIGTKFKRLFHSLTERKLYVSYVNALDQESVCSAIRYGREIVKWEEEKPVFGSSETVYSGEEPSSYSH